MIGVCFTAHLAIAVFGSPDVWPIICMPTLSSKGIALMWNGIMILGMDSFPIFIFNFFPMLHVDDWACPVYVWIQQPLLEG